MDTPRESIFDSADWGFGGFLLFLAGFFCVYFLIAALEGFTLSNLWRWYVVPATGWHGLSIAQAIGITMTVEIVKTSPTINEKRSALDFFWLFAKPVVILFLCWIVLHFV